MTLSIRDHCKNGGDDILERVWDIRGTTGVLMTVIYFNDDDDENESRETASLCF